MGRLDPTTSRSALVPVVVCTPALVIEPAPAATKGDIGAGRAALNLGTATVRCGQYLDAVDPRQEKEALTGSVRTRRHDHVRAPVHCPARVCLMALDQEAGSVAVRLKGKKLVVGRSTAASEEHHV